MRALIICPDFPYPPNHGGRADIWSRIVVWKESGVEIDLVVTTSNKNKEQDEETVKKFVREIYYTPRTKNLAYLFLGIPFQASSRSALAKFSCDHYYDFAILESEAVSLILKSIKKNTRNIVLRVHNNEANYFRALFKSETNLFRKMYYLIESLLYQHHSLAIKKQCDYILHISKDEFDSDLSVIAPPEKLRYVPPHLPPHSFHSIRKSKSSRVLFVGNLFTANNIQGLKWYLDYVHPILLSHPDYEFVIAGNTRGKRFHFSTIPRVTFFDSPTDLTAIYDSATIVVNPILAGAGVKLRTLNAIQMGFALVTTRVGSEGLNFLDKEHILIANLSTEFADHILFLLNNYDERILMATRAQDYARENFDCSNLLHELADASGHNELDPRIARS